jgi:hypothetical protein
VWLMFPNASSKTWWFSSNPWPYLVYSNLKKNYRTVLLSIYRYIYIILYTLHVSRFLTFFLAGGACNKHVQINGRRSLEASVASYGAATGGFWQGAVALRTRMPLGLWGQGGDEKHGNASCSGENCGYLSMIFPIGSMYGIYANIWGILMVNVT